MSRRTRQQKSPSPPAHFDLGAVEDDDMDDELARELEEERQKILAASANGQASGSQSRKASPPNDGTDDEGSMQPDVDDEDDLDPEDIPEEDDSADEWQPPEPPSKATRQSKRRRRQASSEEDSDDAGVDQELSEDEAEPAAKKSKKVAPSKTKKANGSHKRAKTPGVEEAQSDQEGADDSFDEEAGRVQAEVEAAAAWADVRRRKEAATNGTTTSSTPSSSNPPPTSSTPSLTAWLGKGPSASSSVAELASSLPMPTTCSAAQVVDRSSLFIGYVYPLTTSSSSYISTLLSHLTRVVHPTVPTTLLPPQFANAPANKRGSSHDMYAYRTFDLKRGRTGLAGPDDFSLQEDKEDDGERWGGDRVLKVAKEEGASDVLVVVSRWYGGELLGPVRFDHIENAARAALREHMEKEEVDEFRQRIQWLDRKISEAKKTLRGDTEGTVEDQVSKYEDLTVDRGQRLWLARQKALEALQKRVTSQSAQASQSDAQVTEADATQEEPASIAEDPAAAPTEAVEMTSSAPGTAEEAAAQDSTVKPEPESIPLDTGDSADNTTTEVQQVKPEPAPITLNSINSPIHVKEEPSSTPPPLFNGPVEEEPVEEEPVEEEEDDKSKVKLEPTEDDGGEDLTGWDDLS